MLGIVVVSLISKNSLSMEKSTSRDNDAIRCLTVDSIKHQTAVGEINDKISIYNNNNATKTKKSIKVATNFGCAVQFTNKGSQVATTSIEDTDLLSYDIECKQLLGRLMVSAHSVTTLAATNLSSLVATVDNTNAYLCDLNKGKIVATFPQTTQQYNLALSISQDEQWIANAQNMNTIYVWNTRKYSEPTIILEQSGHWPYSVAFNPDNSLLASGGDNEDPGHYGYTYPVYLWDVSTGKIMYTFDDATNNIMKVKFSDDGAHLMCASMDNKVRVYEVATGEKVEEIDFWVTPFADFDVKNNEAVGQHNYELQVKDIPLTKKHPHQD